jgi:hypothetical protein
MKFFEFFKEVFFNNKEKIKNKEKGFCSLHLTRSAKYNLRRGYFE